MILPTINVRYKNCAINKKGLLPLILQVTFNRKTFARHLSIYIEPGKLEGNAIKGVDRLTVMRNIEIKKAISELEDRFIKASYSTGLTLELVKELVSGRKVEDLSMNEVYLKIESIYKGVLSKSRFKSLKSSTSKFDTWSESLPVERITGKMLLAYEGYLREERQHKETSVWSDMMDLKGVMTKALKHGITTANPFAEYKNPTYKAPLREYLESSEVNAVEAYADDLSKSPLLRNVAAWFLLGCYSGMRYGDLAGWNEERMVRKDRLYFSDQKTSTPHYIPLYGKLMESIHRVRAFSRIPTDQECNRYLKEIAAINGITKNVTMHMARHTFAVAYLDKGGTMDVLQKLMGHKKIETTAVYGKITDKRITDEAAKVFGN